AQSDGCADPDPLARAGSLDAAHRADRAAGRAGDHRPSSHPAPGSARERLRRTSGGLLRQPRGAGRDGFGHDPVAQREALSRRPMIQNGSEKARTVAASTTPNSPTMVMLPGLRSVRVSKIAWMIRLWAA